MKKIILIGLFIAIVLLGGFLRFYKLGAVPNSMDWDEVSWGYNAYSVLLTGKDEYGQFLPLSFKAFGDYKQPVYVYSELLPIQLFGLNAFSVRFPSALFGTASIPFVFLLVYELFRKKKYGIPAAFLSMLFFAISPWHIQFSRVAFESILGLFFVLVGVWVFLRGLRLQKPWYFFAAALVLAISAYSYHAQKLFTPLFVVGLVIFAKDYFLKHKKLFIAFGVCFVLFNSLWLLDARTTARGKSVLFTSEQTQLLKIPLIESNQDVQNGQKLFSVMHNRRIIYMEKFLSNYLNHFNLNWLFIEGDLARHHAPDFGLLYIISLPFILLGAYFLISNEQTNVLLLGYWFMLAPVSGALVTGAPNAERALIMLPIWQIMEAFGFIQLARLFKKKIFIAMLAVVTAIDLFLFMLYTHQYFMHTNTDYDRYWQYGYQQAIDYVSQPQFADKKVYFDQSIEQGYVFYLFYKQVDPKTYLAGGGSNRLQQPCYSIGTAYFGNCPIGEKGDIFVTAKLVGTSSFHLIKTIPYYLGDPAVYIYQLQ